MRRRKSPPAIPARYEGKREHTGIDREREATSNTRGITERAKNKKKHKAMEKGEKRKTEHIGVKVARTEHTRSAYASSVSGKTL